MSDLKTFEARERKQINGKMGCMLTAGIVGTIIFFVALIAGWNKIAVFMILAPIALLFTPLMWRAERKKLRNALERKNPAAVVQMFIQDSNAMLSDGSAPAFAYEALSPTVRESVGDMETFHKMLRTSLSEAMSSGAKDEVISGTCARCGVTKDYVRLAIDGKYAPAGDTKFSARCTKCQRSYCPECSIEIYKDMQRLFGDRFRCECGSKVYLNHETLLDYERLRRPFLKVGIPSKREWSIDQDAVLINTIAMYRDTGVSRPKSSSGMSATKSLAFVTGKMTIAFPMRCIDESWYIDAIPTIASDTKLPGKQRWTDAPDAMFE